MHSGHHVFFEATLFSLSVTFSYLGLDRMNHLDGYRFLFAYLCVVAAYGSSLLHPSAFVIFERSYMRITHTFLAI